jgi:hypothetical protein
MQLAEFNGSVMAQPMAGEVSGRCHDGQANLQALHLLHDIVTGVNRRRSQSRSALPLRRVELILLRYCVSATKYAKRSWRAVVSRDLGEMVKPTPPEARA